MGEKNDRCWPGYEPVPGKPAHSQGSCRPKAESKSTDAEKKFRAKRHKQLENWKAEHKGAKKQSAQHLSAPGSQKKKTAKAAGKKSQSTAKKATSSAVRKRAATKRATAGKQNTKQAAVKRTPAAKRRSPATRKAA